MKSTHVLRACFLMSAIPLCFGGSASAATWTWDGGSAVDSNWSTAANWVGDTVPTNGMTTDLIFTGVLRTNPTISTSWGVNSITFAAFAGANPFTLGGASTIAIGVGGITNNDTDTQTFNTGTIGIGGAVTTSFNGTSGLLVFNNSVSLAFPTSVLNLTGSVTMNNSITGSGSVGANGTVILAGAGDTRSYDLTVSGGTVTMSHTGTATVSSTGSITLNGGSLAINSNLTLDNAQFTRAAGAAFTIGAGRTLAVTNGADVGITGTYDLATSGTINVSGTGSTFSATSAVNLRGGSTVSVTSGGSFSAATFLDIGSATNGAMVIDGAGSNLSITNGANYIGYGAGTGVLAIRNSATATSGGFTVAAGTTAGTVGSLGVESGATLTSGNLNVATGVGAVTGTVAVTGTGSTITLTGASSLSLGASSASTGTLNVDSSGVFNTGTGSVWVNKTGRINITGGTLNAYGNLTVEGQLVHTTGGLTLAADKSLTVQNGGSASFSGVRGFSNNVTVTGVSSALSASGFLYLNNNTVSVASGGRINSASGLKIGTTAGNSVVTVDGAGSSFGLSGAAGQVDLGDQTYSGSLTFSNNATGSLGYLSTALGMGGSSATLTVQSGADVTTTHIAAESGVAVTTNILVTGAGSTLTQTGASFMGLGGAGNSSFTLTVADGGVFASGTGLASVYKTGTIRINANGTYTSNGDLTISDGLLTRDTNGSFYLAAGRTLTARVGGDATFTGDQYFTTACNVSVAGSGSTLSTTGSVGFFGGSIASVTTGGTISSATFGIGASGVGSGTVTVDGTGSLFVNTAAAGTSIIGDGGTAGSLTIRNLATGTLRALDIAHTVGAGTTGSLSVETDADVTVDSLRVADTATAATGTITISGSGSTLTQNGAATLTLGAASLSSGTFTVSSNGMFTSGTGLTTVGTTGTINVTGGTYNANGNMTLDGGRLNRDATGAFTLAGGKILAIQNGGDAVFGGLQNFATPCTINVTGAGSTLTTTSDFEFSGGSVTTISSQGTLSASGYLDIGVVTNGTVVIDGTGCTISSGSGESYLGINGGVGSLTLKNQATGTLGGFVIGGNSTSGTNGSLTIQSGATATLGSTRVAPVSATGVTGSITVTGSASVLTMSGASTLTVGSDWFSTGTLTAASGGRFNSGTGLVTVKKTGTINITGGTYASNGNLTLDGGQMTRDATGTFTLGVGKTLAIQNGGDAVISGGQTFSSSFVNVAGTGSTLSSGLLTLLGTNATTVSGGGRITATELQIGETGNASLTVDGAGSTFETTSLGSSYIASGATGTVTFRDGGTGTLTGLYIASNPGGGGTGTLTIESSGDVTARFLGLATAASPSTASLNVTGTGSTLIQTGNSLLVIGAASASTATFTVSDGGAFASSSGLTTVNATGTININGGTYYANGNMLLDGGKLIRDATGAFNLDSGKNLTIQNGGDALITGGLVLAHAQGVRIANAGSTFSVTNLLDLGGGSNIAVQPGGSLAAFNFHLGTAAGDGTVTVDGAGSSLLLGSSCFIGFGGHTGSLAFSNGSVGTFQNIDIAEDISGTEGTLLIRSGADVLANDIQLAPNSVISTGTITVDGEDSTLTLPGAAGMCVGANSLSTGTLTISNGASFTSGTGEVVVDRTGRINITGGTYTSNGNLTIHGGQLTRDAAGVFNLEAGTALTIGNGGAATITGGQFFPNASALVVTGTGSTLTQTGGSLMLGSGFTASVTSGGMLTADRLVVVSSPDNSILTVDGGGSTLTATTTELISALGASSSLIFSNHSTGDIGDFRATVSPDHGANDLLAIRSGAAVASGDLRLGTGTGVSTGTIEVDGIGSRLTQTGGAEVILGSNVATTATLRASNGGTFTSGTGDFTLNPTGTLLIDAGTVILNGHLVRNGGTLDFDSGSLSIIDDLTVGTGGLLGEAPVFTSARQFTTTGATIIDPYRTITVDGGRYSTGSLTNNGGVFDFRRGTLAVTGAGGLTLGGSGPLGSLFTIDAGSTLEVTHDTTVQSGASLIVEGSTVIGGTLANQAGGRITLREGTGLIAGSGAVSNSGLIKGDGIISTALTNNAGGELRAEIGRSLLLTGPNGPNAGRLSLQGGTLEFAEPLTNSATGAIQGHGAAYFNGGLTNQGAMNFSGGAADLYGDISMTGGSGGSARLISSGGGTVSVFGDFVHNGAEVRTSTGCNTVFWGNVSGAGTYTGTGTVYYEGTFSPGSSPASVSYGGGLVFGTNLVTLMEIGGLLRGSQYDALQVAGDLVLGGTLNVSLINGFTPAAGNSFDLFDWGTLTGTFDAMNLPVLDGGLLWDTDGFYTDGTLSVIANGPPVPSGLAVEPALGLALRATWNPASGSTTGFELQRARDLGFTVDVATFILGAEATSYTDAGLTPSTTFFYRLRALGSPSPSDYCAPVSSATLSRIEDWRWTHFGDPRSIGLGADDQDPDHDGAVNLVEYATNLDPNVSDAVAMAADGTAGLPLGAVNPSGHLTLTFLRRTASSVPGITQGVVFSDDLAYWHPEESASAIIETIDTLWERVIVTDPAPPAARRFVRTTVTTP